MSILNVQRHIKYFNLTLGILPTRVQSQDSNKLLLIYCAIAGLSLLKYEFPKSFRDELIDFVYKHLVPSKEGFRGSLSHSISGEKLGSQYDPATLANTYSALCILLMLEDDYLSKLDAGKIMQCVSKCQLDDGSFLSLIDINDRPFGDGDLRQVYLATCIKKLLKYPDGGKFDINTETLTLHVQSKLQYDGGLGSFESHAGLTFCGLAALANAGKLNTESKLWTKTIDWLVHRQISFNDYNKSFSEYEFSDLNDQGAQNGRDNKFGDTCYSFWCSGSLSILKSKQYVNVEQSFKYLLDVTQNGIIGGFAKNDNDDPDPYHSFLGLAALSVLGHPDLLEIDPLLVVPKKYLVRQQI